MTRNQQSIDTPRVMRIRIQQSKCVHKTTIELPRFVTWKRGTEKVCFAQTILICSICGSFREARWDDPNTPTGNDWVRLAT